MDYRIELRHLRYFIAVAEELHFGRAAQRLHLAQPPLSQQIRQLEAIVGHPLFTRTSRAVKLTSSGEALLGRARRTLQSVEEGLEEARSIGRGEVGFLRVGLIGSCMLTMQAGVPALLREYRQRYPKVNLQLQESFTSGVIRGLATGVLDAGFLRDGGPCDGLVVQKIFTEPFVAVLPSSHRLAKRKTISTRDLRDEPFVFFPREAGLRAYERSISVCEVNGFRPRVVQEASNWLTILRLVGTGLGVTIAPDCVRQIAARDVICRPLKESEVRSDIELAYRMNEDRAMVKAFAAAIRSAPHSPH
jgi:DNA-binding transcriptional LysR family regulator